jgi:hypothetical protein
MMQVQLSYIWQQRYQLKFQTISHELNPGELFRNLVSLSVTFSLYVIIINVCVSTYISNGVTMAKLDAFYCKQNILILNYFKNR